MSGWLLHLASFLCGLSSMPTFWAMTAAATAAATSRQVLRRRAGSGAAKDGQPSKISSSTPTPILLRPCRRSRTLARSVDLQLGVVRLSAVATPAKPQCTRVEHARAGQVWQLAAATVDFRDCGGGDAAKRAIERANECDDLLPPALLTPPPSPSTSFAPSVLTPRLLIYGPVAQSWPSHTCGSRRTTSSFSRSYTDLTAL